jgi:hypothetical protein
MSFKRELLRSIPYYLWVQHILPYTYSPQCQDILHDIRNYKAALSTRNPVNLYSFSSRNLMMEKGKKLEFPEGQEGVRVNQGFPLERTRFFNEYIITEN